MFNTTAPDIIQYLSPEYKSVVHRCVVTKMNEVFLETKKSCRNFRGKVSVVAHSLGTVITYDILKLQGSSHSAENQLELTFNLESLFLLGSPLGLFTSVYSSENFIRAKLPKCARFYNIYHPSDLIAYRIEPLLRIDSESDGDPESVELPVLVPCYWNMGLNSAQMIKFFFSKNE